MTDLVAFLRARLDEEQAIADACAAQNGAGWSAGDVNLGEAVTAEQGGYVACAPYEGALSWETRQHLARHDPARVLAEVEAKRRIIDEYVKAADRRAEHPDDLASAAALLIMLRVLKLSALPYADRPDYDPSWKPA